MCVCVCACAYVYCMCVCICMQSDFCCPFNSAVLRPKFGAPNLRGVLWDLFCLTSVVRGFWVRSLVRPGAGDGRGLAVYI